jgi:phage anti-repressor protein
MSNLNFSPEQALAIYNSTEEFPVNFDAAWVWLNYSSKGNAKVHFMKCNFEKGIDYKVFMQTQKNSNGGRPTETIKLSIDCLKVWAMMANTKQGRLVRHYFLDCEKIAKQKVKAVASTRRSAPILGLPLLPEFTYDFARELSIAIMFAQFGELEKLVNSQELVTTSRVNQLIDIDPRGKVFVRGSFTFTRQGKIGYQSSWLVTRTPLEFIDSQI